MELTTLDSVKEFLGKDIGEEAGETSDELLEQLIKAASETIANEAEREFLPTGGAERTFGHGGGRILNLTPYDLRTIEFIRTDVDGTSATLEASDYRLCPRSPRHGVYEWVNLTADPGECEITIKGNWGFAAVPVDVEHAAKLTVAAWLRDDVFAYTPELETPGPLMRGLLPSAVSVGLEKAYGKALVG